MEFNLTKTPPTLNDISAERESLRSNIKKLTIEKWGLISALFINMIVVLNFIKLLSNNENEWLAIPFALWMMVTFFYIFTNLDLSFKNLKLTYQDIDALEIIDQELCSDAINLCKNSQTISDYQNQVSKQGRMLVRAEYSAMKILKDDESYEHLSKWNNETQPQLN